MAQTIQIKRSTSTVIPTSLASGELAYSAKTGTQKLYIGDGSNVLTIGGKSFTDKLDLIGTATSVTATASLLGASKLFSDTTQTVAANGVTTTAARTYGIQHNSSDQMVVNIPWVNTEYTAGTGLTLSGTVFNANVDGTTTVTPNASSTTAGRLYKVQVDSSDNLVVNVPWSGGSLATTLGIGNDTSGNDIDVSAGDDITFTTTSKAIFGGTSSTANRMEIYHDGTSSRIEELGTGGLIIEGEDLTFQDNSQAIAMKMTTVGSDRVFEFRDGSDVQIAQFKAGEIKINSSSQLKTDDISETTSAHGVHIDGVILKDGEVEGNIKTDLISEKTAANGVVIDSVTLKDGGVFATGEVEGGSLDINGAADISGGLAVTGDSSINGNLFFANNNKIQMGTTSSSTNLEIYTDNSNAIIEENRSGNLLLRGTNLNLQGADNTNYLQAVLGGAVTLYHTTSDGSGGYNATPRIATSSSGATVSGSLTVTGDLNITGDVNSTSVTDLDVADKTITVGVGQLAADSSNSGITVAGADAKIVYEYDTGTSSGKFEIDQGAGTQAAILTAANWGTEYTGVVDGGTF